MPKRTNTKRADGRFSVQVYLGKDETGHRRYKTVYGHTQKEADAAADVYRAKIRKGIDTARESDTFAQWRDRWFAVKLLDIGASQASTYRSYFRHLAPIDGIPLRDIQPHHVQTIIADLAAWNPHTGKPTAKKTLTDIRNTARQIFAYAVENRVLEFNPIDSVRVPKNAPQAARRSLTASEIELIRTTPHKLQTASMIMLYAGLRRSETIALLWSDVDLVNGTISVTKAANLKDQQNPIKTTKTAAGTRIVYIPDVLIDYLAMVKRDNMLVCPTSHGRMYTASAWKSAWRGYLLTLDLASGKHPQKRSRYDPMQKGILIDNITPHMLRHTACTMQIEAGLDPSTVQHQLGHSDIRTTLAVYTHVSDQHRQNQIEKLNSYINNTPENACDSKNMQVTCKSADA